MIKGILFDFDGVLVHSECANIEAAKKTFKDIGKPLTPDEVNSVPGTSSLDFIPIFLKARGMESVSECQRLYEINRGNYQMLWSRVITMFPSTQQTIETLFAQKKILAIATTNRRETVDMFFEKFGMSNKFSLIVTSEDIKRRKPDPEIYSLTIQKLGIPPEHLIAIEDTAIGLTAAHAAGLRCAVVPNEYTENHDFSKADFVLQSIAEVLNIV